MVTCSMASKASSIARMAFFALHRLASAFLYERLVAAPTRALRLCCKRRRRCRFAFARSGLQLLSVVCSLKDGLGTVYSRIDTLPKRTFFVSSVIHSWPDSLESDKEASSSSPLSSSVVQQKSTVLSELADASSAEASLL